MAFPQGVNFRSTLAYVTDGATETFQNGAINYPTTSAQGNTLGIEATCSAANRSTAVVRLAGIVYTATTGAKWRIDLPATGTYNINFAAGDQATANQTQWSIRDTTTKLGADITTGGTDAGGKFKDANDALHTTAANWVANNTARAFTFTTTICRLYSERTTGNTVVSHFYIEAADSGVTGTSATTNAADTSSATGTTTIVGTLAKTNAHDTSSASGTTTVTGSLATTNAADTSDASGSVGGDITGTVAVTNAADTSAASGSTTIVGTVARTNSADTVDATGTVSGTAAVTNADDTATSTAPRADDYAEIVYAPGTQRKPKQDREKRLGGQYVELDLPAAVEVPAAKPVAAPKPVAPAKLEAEAKRLDVLERQIEAQQAQNRADDAATQAVAQELQQIQAQRNSLQTLIAYEALMRRIDDEEVMMLLLA